MSRGSKDPRRELVQAAAHILAEHGPAALTTRRLAGAVGTSTMAVYTHFGGMPDLVREVIREGFARLAERLAAVPETDDPVADSYALAAAYRQSALANPHLYAVMFGGSTIAGFELSAEDRQIGVGALRYAHGSVRRCIEAGRFRPAEPWAVVRHYWCQLHGLVQLELAGYLAATPADLRELLRNFAIGAGDSPAAATAALARLAGAPDQPVNA